MVSATRAGAGMLGLPRLKSKTFSAPNFFARCRPNWLRLSYCVETERVENALPLLKKTIDELKEKKGGV